MTNRSIPITIYTSGPQCVDCNTMKCWLDEHDFSYTERNIRTDPHALEALQQLGYSSVPVTIIDDTIIDGLDIGALQTVLRTS